VKRAIAGIAPLAGEAAREEEADSATGVTNRVRSILKGSGGVFMTPKQIRDHIEQFHGALKYSNPMAVIHQVLRRLVEQNEIVEDEGVIKGQKAYGWKPRREYSSPTPVKGRTG
jgi:hypothetical protein